MGSAGFEAELSPYSYFGCSVDSMDVDGDGQLELIVGARGDADGGFNTGAVFVIFLTATAQPPSSPPSSPSAAASPSSTASAATSRRLQSQSGAGGVRVLRSAKLSKGSGNLPLDAGSRFGTSLASVGDINSDGIPDLLVGVPGHGGGSGALVFLALNSDGSAAAALRISPSEWDPSVGPPVGSLPPDAHFGHAVGVAHVAGSLRIAVGAPNMNGGAGAVYMLRVRLDGALEAVSALPQPAGLEPNSQFGRALAFTADWDGNGLPELVVGAPRAPEGGSERGAVYVLKLDGDGTQYYDAVKLTEEGGGRDGARFGRAIGVSSGCS